MTHNVKTSGVHSLNESQARHIQPYTQRVTKQTCPLYKLKHEVTICKDTRCQHKNFQKNMGDTSDKGKHEGKSIFINNN